MFKQGKISTLERRQMSYVFERHEGGNTTLTLGGATLGQTFSLLLPDYSLRTNNLARLPLTDELLDGDKPKIIAQAAFHAAYMNGYFNRDGRPRNHNDSGIVESFRQLHPQSQFSFSARIGRTLSDIRPVKSFWAYTVTAPQVKVA